MSRFLVTFLFITVYTGFQVSLEASQNNPNTPIDSVYYLKGREFFVNAKYDSALVYIEKAIEESKRLNNNRLEIASNRAAALLNRNLNNYSKALYFYNKALDLTFLYGENFQLSSIYNGKGILFKEAGKYDSALYYYYKSLSFAEDQGSVRDISFVLNNIGTIYSALENHEEALSTFQRSLNLKLENQIYDQIVTNYYNVGSTLNTLEQPEDALSVFFEALSLCDSIHCNSNDLADIYSYMSESYIKIKDTINARKYLEIAYKLAEENSYVDNIVQTTRSLGLLKKMEGDFDSSLYFLNKSINIATKNNLIESQKYTIEVLYSLYNSIGDYEKALTYYQEFSRLKDSLFNEEVASRMQEIVVDFETKEAQETISAQDQEIRLRRQINFLLGLSILLTIAIIIRFFLDLNRRKAMNRRLDREVERKTRELQDTLNLLQQSKNDLDNLIYNISHEIRGPLATLMGLIKVGKMEYGEEDKVHLYLDKLDETAESLNSILKRMIIINSINHYDTVIKDVNIESTIKGVLDTKIDIENTGLTVRADYDGIKSIPTDKGLLETALENIIQNSVRYSDKKENTKLLDIKVRPNDTEGVDIILSDNGIGFDSKYKNHVMDLFFVANEEAGEGIGLHHAKLAVQKLKGEIEIASTRKPTTFIIHLPYSSKKN